MESLEIVSLTQPSTPRKKKVSRWWQNAPDMLLVVYTQDAG
jgi:hypothetical protein